MNETAYHSNLDVLMNHMEDILDLAESDLDYINNNGLLTITCESGVQIIISRQAPLLQLWVASPAGGIRFVYNQEQAQWQQENDQQISLGQCLSQLLQQYADEDLDCTIID